MTLSTYKYLRLKNIKCDNVQDIYLEFMLETVKEICLVKHCTCESLMFLHCALIPIVQNMLVCVKVSYDYLCSKIWYNFIQEPLARILLTQV